MAAIRTVAWRSVPHTKASKAVHNELHDCPKMGIPLYVVVDPRKDKKTGPPAAGRSSSLKSYPADW
ncbi:hypothetical protein ACFQ7Z_34320 [Streptomyces virginiae]|uniref:hypothetical protein n=1 Tax=Streptomyces virginiae TaxID=1961 RepID=UPI0036B2131C